MAKKGLGLLVAAFAVFYLLSEPESAADAVRGAGNALAEAFDQVTRFFTRLFS